MTFTVLRNSCTLYTFTVLRQKALAFTLPPPYDLLVPAGHLGPPLATTGAAGRLPLRVPTEERGRHSSGGQWWPQASG
jgi:hypothetical protein